MTNVITIDTVPSPKLVDFGERGAVLDTTPNIKAIADYLGFGFRLNLITHDIDEAILLADRILLMTNGPQARVAESVEITIPRPRNRIEIVEHPNYYAIRNHLVQFLGKRSREMAGQPTEAGQTNAPETVKIDMTEITEEPEDKQPSLKAINM